MSPRRPTAAKASIGWRRRHGTCTATHGRITWSAGWILLPAAAGVLMKLRKKSVVDVRERAVISERLRLAQEVHDVVGHGLSVIAMQAGVALYVLDKDPATTFVIIDEVETDNWGVNRESVTARRRREKGGEALGETRGEFSAKNSEKNSGESGG